MLTFQKRQNNEDNKRGYGSTGEQVEHGEFVKQ